MSESVNRYFKIKLKVVWIFLVLKRLILGRVLLHCGRLKTCPGDWWSGHNDN